MCYSTPHILGLLVHKHGSPSTDVDIKNLILAKGLKSLLRKHFFKFSNRFTKKCGQTSFNIAENGSRISFSYIYSKLGEKTKTQIQVLSLTVCSSAKTAHQLELV